MPQRVYRWRIQNTLRCSGSGMRYADSVSNVHGLKTIWISAELSELQRMRLWKNKLDALHYIVLLSSFKRNSKEKKHKMYATGHADDMHINLLHRRWCIMQTSWRTKTAGSKTLRKHDCRGSNFCKCKTVVMLCDTKFANYLIKMFVIVALLCRTVTAVLLLYRALFTHIYGFMIMQISSAKICYQHVIVIK